MCCSLLEFLTMKHVLCMCMYVCELLVFCVEEMIVRTSCYQGLIKLVCGWEDSLERYEFS